MAGIFKRRPDFEYCRGIFAREKLDGKWRQETGFGLFE